MATWMRCGGMGVLDERFAALVKVVERALR